MTGSSRIAAGVNKRPTKDVLSPLQRGQLDKVVRALLKGIEPDERGHVWILPNYEEVEDFAGGSSNEYPGNPAAQCRFEKWNRLVGRADFLRPTHDEQWLALRLCCGQEWSAVDFHKLSQEGPFA